MGALSVPAVSRGDRPINERVVAKKTEHGLQHIEWEEMREGDLMLLTDWKDGWVVDQIALKFCRFDGVDESGDPLAFTYPMSLDVFWGHRKALDAHDDDDDWVFPGHVQDIS